MADLTSAEELRAAAARLRERPPGDDLLVGLLDAREPLAALFDDLADETEAIDASEVILGPDATYDTGVTDHRGELRPDLTHALATARVILGGGRD